MWSGCPISNPSLSLLSPGSASLAIFISHYLFPGTEQRVALLHDSTTVPDLILSLGYWLSVSPRGFPAGSLLFLSLLKNIPIGGIGCNKLPLGEKCVNVSAWCPATDHRSSQGAFTTHTRIFWDRIWIHPNLTWAPSMNGWISHRTLYLLGGLLLWHVSVVCTRSDHVLALESWSNPNIKSHFLALLERFLSAGYRYLPAPSNRDPMAIGMIAHVRCKTAA